MKEGSNLNSILIGYKLLLIFFTISGLAIGQGPDKPDTNKVNNGYRLGNPEQFSIGLYFKDIYGRRRNADGVLAEYNNSYSTGLGSEDAVDVPNWDEDLALMRFGQALSIEGRPLIDELDTLFLRVLRLKQQVYELQFDAINFAHPTLNCFLYDKFLGTKTPLDLTGTTIVSFAVTSNSASSASDRFTIYFVSCPKPLVTGLFSLCDSSSTTQLTGAGTPNQVNPWVSSAPADYSVSNTGLVTRMNSKLGSTSTISYLNNVGCSENVIVGTNLAPSIEYFSKATGNLNDLSTWGTNFDGTGDAPVSFLNNNIFYLTSLHTGSKTLTSPWDLGSKLFIEPGLVLNSAGFLTIKSFCSHTGSIGQLDGGADITGEVTVERFISANDNRAYRFLGPSVNTIGGSKPFIKDNWQEGVNKANAWAVDGNDPNPGYGTHLTGSAAGLNGFDATPSGAASIFTFNSSTQNWESLPNTNATGFDGKMAFATFVRGNRSTNLLAGSPFPSSNTTLRAKGQLLRGDQVFVGLPGSGAYSLVTNPYAAPIDWVNVISSNGTTNFSGFAHVWDPNIGTRGGYVSIGSAGQSSNPIASNLSRFLQSGQGFFVQVSSPGTYSFTISEDHKADNNSIDVFRIGKAEQLNVGLYFTDGIGRRRNADGVLVEYNNLYTAGIGIEDASDLPNWDENLSIARHNKLLSIEGRPLIDLNDTVFIRVDRLKQQGYELQLDAINFNHPSLQGFLVDKYLGTQTAINISGRTIIPFNVTADTLSSASDRFSVVFSSTGPLPVTISGVKAYNKNNGVQVEWTVQNEINMEKYEVEHSSDARVFRAIGSVKALGSVLNTYSYFDVNALTGTNYYRIRSIGKTGDMQYSQIVKVNIGKGSALVSVYPNPVNGNSFNLNLNAEKGEYNLVITNNIGQQLYNKAVNHDGSYSVQTIILNNRFVKGSYQLQIIGKKEIQTINLYKQ